MDTQDIINYYAGLLINQYLGQPNAYATMQALITPVVMDELPSAVMNAYNLSGASTAVGVQLDVLGKYAGVTRYGQGLNGPITLSDADFLQLIRFAILTNNSGSSLYQIQTLLFQFFPGEVLVFDYTTMRMGYLVNSTVGSADLIQVVISQNILPKPMGVSLAPTIYAPVINAFFGMRTYSMSAYNASPFNDYASYQTDWPWISYGDAFGTTYLQHLMDEDGDYLDTESGEHLTLE